MKKVILAVAVAAMLVFAATAGAETVRVADPTPNGQFTGEYTYDCTDEAGNPATCEGTQVGYVQLSSDGGPEVIACNGNQNMTTPDGEPIQGYAYLSPTGSGPASPSTGGNKHIGATDGTETGDGSPCP